MAPQSSDWGSFYAQAKQVRAPFSRSTHVLFPIFWPKLKVQILICVFNLALKWTKFFGHGMKKIAFLFGWYYIYSYICLCKNDNNPLIQSIMTTTNFRLRILSFVQEHFILSSRVYTLTDLSKSLKCLSSYKLSNLYNLLRKCRKIDMPLTIDYIILLANDYAFSANFSEFVTRFYRSSIVFNGKLSATEVLYIVNYLNLTFDESVSPD